MHESIEILRARVNYSRAAHAASAVALAVREADLAEAEGHPIPEADRVALYEQHTATHIEAERLFFVLREVDPCMRKARPVTP